MKEDKINLKSKGIITYIDKLKKNLEFNPRSKEIVNIWIPGIANDGFINFMEKMEKLKLIDIKTIEEYKEYIVAHKIEEISPKEKKDYLAIIGTCLENFSQSNKDENGKNFWIPRYGKSRNGKCIIRT